ncbi:MAG: Ribose-5-phosphate isomerase B [bacterium ADurb.Bin270]|nr:ribose 5-phosphate isomerase B [Myxococcales bacterium]OQA58673.1 MAG: Ribose-5-phosphate isomerase B [bacterium ADurb.Bin270]
MQFKIAIGSDHAGFELKEHLKKHLQARCETVIDCGPRSAEKSDYPDYAKEVSGLVSRGECDRGLLVCGSGIGMCMAANRYRGVRAAVLRDQVDAELARRHNDANVACIGARITAFDMAVLLTDVFLMTQFEGGRHEPRIAKIEL